jgi:hypothetical protein
MTTTMALTAEMPIRAAARSVRSCILDEIKVTQRWGLVAMQVAGGFGL